MVLYYDHFACFFWFVLCELTDDSHVTGLGGVKQEIQDIKSGLESLINIIRSESVLISDGKFSKINLWLKDMKASFASTVNYV